MLYMRTPTGDLNIHFIWTCTLCHTTESALNWFWVIIGSNWSCILNDSHKSLWFQGSCLRPGDPATLIALFMTFIFQAIWYVFNHSSLVLTWKGYNGTNKLFKWLAQITVVSRKLSLNKWPCHAKFSLNKTLLNEPEESFFMGLH